MCPIVSYANTLCSILKRGHSILATVSVAWDTFVSMVHNDEGYHTATELRQVVPLEKMWLKSFVNKLYNVRLAGNVCFSYTFWKIVSEKVVKDLIIVALKLRLKTAIISSTFR